MLFAPVPLGKRTFSGETLTSDIKTARKFGSCGVGKMALYLGSYFLDRHYYVPWPEVRRVFKRVAMSRGGFSGRGIFGSVSFLVVQLSDGVEKACRVKRESDIDRLLAAVREEHPGIPVHSAAAEKKLAEAAAAEEARYLKTLSPAAEEAVRVLREEQGFLEKRSSICDMLVAAAKQKRIIDHMSPALRIGGAIFGILGILTAAFGLYGLLTRLPYALYFLLGGGAVFFLTLSANIFPSRWNSPKTASADWENALADARQCLAGRDTFSVPAQYAHPIVLARMIRVIREGRAENAADALRLVKEDLRALNASVRVSQAEYDEVVTIKPLFLVCDYRDDLEKVENA